MGPEPESTVRAMDLEERSLVIYQDSLGSSGFWLARKKIVQTFDLRFENQSFVWDIFCFRLFQILHTVVLILSLPRLVL